MKEATRLDHRAFARRLREHVLEGPGITEAALRRGVAARASDGPVVPAPYDALARQIAEAAPATTDAQVADVVRAAGSEKAAFEIVLAAAVGAGLARWQRAIGVLDEAGDAPA